MVAIRNIQPGEWIPVVRELMGSNWAETGFDFPFEPSADRYQALVDAGIMFALAAFDGERLVGYCTMIVAPTMHNPSVILAANDALFVMPEYRGITGGRMIRTAEREAKLRGACRVLWHTRAGTNLHESMARHGYVPADIVMMKEL
jgi:GNAT superfamily N-acetyltransferase